MPSHVDKLLKRGVVTETRFLVSVMLSDSLGRGSAGAPDYRVAYIEPKSEHAKYGIKPIFVAFGVENARTIIDNMASGDWASFCEINPWQ